ncbi:MAG: YraN family protein [Deltaproteobacteria bacterium]|jgi:putative endonuclease|nr:YraN family protein [Deltaproteobacteria bacterium]
MRGGTDGKSGHLATGLAGEDAAAAYLESLGLELLERNWRPPASAGRALSLLELDIVAQEGDILVFAEVKTRSFSPCSDFSPLDAFTRAKRGRLLKAAALYLEEAGLWRRPCRFDLLCITLYPDHNCKLEHFRNVLSFGTLRRGIVDCGHSPWQPW